MDTPVIHVQSIRASAVLTTSYVACTVLRGDDYNFLGLELTFTKGSLTSMELKIEVSDDGTTYYQQVAEATSGGTVTPSVAERTFTTGAPTYYALEVHPIRAKYIKVSVKGTGTVTNSLCAVTGILAWV